MHGQRQLRGRVEGMGPASDTECFSRDRLGVERLSNSSEDDDKSRRSCKGLGEGLMWLVGHWVFWDMQSLCTEKVSTERRELLGDISVGLKTEAEFLWPHKSQSICQGRHGQQQDNDTMISFSLLFDGSVTGFPGHSEQHSQGEESPGPVCGNRARQDCLSEHQRKAKIKKSSLGVGVMLCKKRPCWLDVALAKCPAAARGSRQGLLCLILKVPLASEWDGIAMLSIVSGSSKTSFWDGVAKGREQRGCVVAESRGSTAASTGNWGCL